MFLTVLLCGFISLSLGLYFFQKSSNIQYYINLMHVSPNEYLPKIIHKFSFSQNQCVEDITKTLDRKQDVYFKISVVLFSFFMICLPILMRLL